MTEDHEALAGILASVGYGLLAWIVILAPLWAPTLLAWLVPSG